MHMSTEPLADKVTDGFAAERRTDQATGRVPFFTPLTAISSTETSLSTRSTISDG
eukprot:COSAG02_NODE_1520_length_12166_cov_8.338195_8_plen_55_part_00